MTVGRYFLPNAVLETTVRTVEVQTEYLYFISRNIKSFGFSLICVVSDIDDTNKRYFKLDRD